MTIIITPEKFIKDFQADFTFAFPYLKIAFYTNTKNKCRDALTLISNQLSFGAANKLVRNKQIIISSYTTVKDFEKELEKKFGMLAQLYRKSGKLWQEITITDIWTMQQQDDRGYEICAIIENYQV